MNRRNDIDALRVIALCLLIVYHVGMIYVADWDFHLKSTYQAQWLQWPMLVLNRWRMPLLFTISGIAIALYQPARAPGRFALTRTWRLLLPLLFGMFVIVPVQAYCEAMTRGTIVPGFGRFLWSYVQVHPWPAGSFTGWQFGITWNHLWYLAYLWIYTLVLIPFLPVLESTVGLRMQAWFANRPGAQLLLLPAIPFFAYRYFLAPYFPETHALFGDWYLHAEYFTAFIFGYAIARHEAFWQAVLRHRRSTLAMAASAFAAYLALRVTGILWPDGSWWDSTPNVWRGISQASQALYMWTALLAIFGYGYAWLNRPLRWLPYASEAVYPWYILHQSLMIVIAYNLIPLHLGPVWEPLLILAGTIGGCLILHETIIRRVAILRPLFGLKPKSRAESARRVLPQIVYADTN
jgi:surface polysaccharide O-acyltransferase-like enzyme